MQHHLTTEDLEQIRQVGPYKASTLMIALDEVEDGASLDAIRAYILERTSASHRIAGEVIKMLTKVESMEVVEDQPGWQSMRSSDDPLRDRIEEALEHIGELSPDALADSSKIRTVARLLTMAVRDLGR